MDVDKEKATHKCNALVPPKWTKAHRIENDIEKWTHNKGDNETKK